MLADEVDDARNAAAGAVDGGDGFVVEDAVGGAGDEQALGDVVRGLLRGDGVGAAPEGDALAELAEVGGAELLFELGLTGEDDLDELFGRGFEVGEQADLFEQLPGKVLGFVDDDDAGLFAAEALDEPAVELDAACRTWCGWLG